MASARAPRSIVRHQRLYRGLLVVYPRSFRHGYGEPMAQLFGDRLRDMGAKAWLSTGPDLVRTATIERIEASMSSPAVPIVAFALAVLGAVAVGIGFGGGVLLFVAAGVVGLLYSQRHLLGSMPRGERAPLRHAVVQTWWAPVAGLLGLMMLAVGVGNAFFASNVGGRTVGSVLMLAFGAAMLFGLMRRPFARPAGNALILLATIPPLLVFWMVIPPLAAIVVWIGVIAGGFHDQPVAPTAAS